MKKHLEDIKMKFPDTSILEASLDIAPQYIIEMYEDFLRVIEGGPISILEGYSCNAVGLDFIPLFHPEKKTVTLSIKGYMLKIVKLNHGIVKSLIAELIGQQLKLTHNLERLCESQESSEENVELINNLEEEIEKSFWEVRNGISIISSYFQKDSLPNCTPLAVAIDPKDDIPCIIVVADIDEVVNEIPKGILERLVLEHLLGENPLEKEYQEALGIKNPILEVQEILKSL